MRFYEFKIDLTEAKGVFGRKAGEPYVHDNGETAEFVQVRAIPDLAEGGQFETPDQRDEAIRQFETDIHAKIEWVNSPNNSMLAFGIAQIRTQDGKDLYWGRYLKKVGADSMGVWSNKEIPTGWKLATKGAQKLDVGLDPQTLIGHGNLMTGPQAIIAKVQANAPAESKEILVNALTESAQGQLARFPGQAQILPAIRDYFGEIMGPVAMMGGAVQGPAEQARTELAGGAEWKDLQIFFPMAKNYNLMDSVFIAPDGKQIGISSKGGAGASASAKNLNDAIVKNQDNAELMETAKFTREVVETIAKSTAKDAPFVLGEKFGISTAKLKQEAFLYQKEAKRDYNGISDEAQEVMSKYNFDQSVQGFNTGYAITSAVAKKVAVAVNKNPEFSKGAIALLNNASIIQLYLNVGKKGDDAVVTGYKSVYPPNFTGVIILDGSKNYYSSRVGGKFAFKFK